MLEATMFQAMSQDCWTARQTLRLLRFAEITLLAERKETLTEIRYYEGVQAKRVYPSIAFRLCALRTTLICLEQLIIQQRDAMETFA